MKQVLVCCSSNLSTAHRLAQTQLDSCVAAGKHHRAYTKGAGEATAGLQATTWLMNWGCTQRAAHTKPHSFRTPINLTRLCSACVLHPSPACAHEHRLPSARMRMIMNPLSLVVIQLQTPKRIQLPRMPQAQASYYPHCLQEAPASQQSPPVTVTSRPSQPPCATQVQHCTS
jgi:hypothetical protein